MARNYAIHAAAAVKQIDYITIANTWAAADQAILTMNGKALTVTIGNDNGTTDVAKAIRNAWNENERLDSEVQGNDATSNFGGQSQGEFAEVEASIDPDFPSVVILTARKAGVPFTVTASETTAGSGTAVRSSSQACTGPWHWDNAKNWSLGAVPVNDDTVVLKDQSGPNVGFKYGLPNLTLEVIFEHWMSYTGPIGLPPINTDNPAKPYPEYRQRWVRLDDAGAGTDIAHRFGLGKEGAGSPLINLKHTTVKCSPIVYATGTSQIQGLKALNLVCTTNTSTLEILGGSVDYSSADGSTSAFTTVTQNGGDSRGVNALKAAAAITVNGGAALISSTLAISVINANGNSQVRIENLTGAVTTLNVIGTSVVDCASAASITSINIDGGTLDCRSAGGAITIGAALTYYGGRILDQYQRLSGTMTSYTELSDALQFGAAIGVPLTISL